MLKETKIIIDEHSKKILDAITNEITDEINTVFDPSTILSSVAEVKNEFLNFFDAVITSLNENGSNWLSKQKLGE